MSEYKCIRCGEVRDSEKECNCSRCGYKMYPLPFERRELLIREIRGFILRLRVQTVTARDFTFYRESTEKRNDSSSNGGEGGTYVIQKSKDDARFPGFTKIQDYICAADRTENFIERLNASIQQIRKHLHETVRFEYKVELAPLQTGTAALDITLNEAMKTLGIAAELPQLELPTVLLDYSEMPDEELIVPTDEILDRLEQLVTKIHKFIKVNNVYGSAYRYKPKRQYKLPEKEADYADDLKKTIVFLQRVLEKKYSVDIFSDGTDELREMLRALWNAMTVIMTIPIRKSISRYCLPTDRTVVGDAIYQELFNAMQQRYVKLDEIVLSDAFLSNKTEEELFTLYSEMVEKDSQGFMGIKKGELSVAGESEKKLNALIGLGSVKDSIRKIKAYAVANSGDEKLNLHMCFYGNPGTGKTEVARVIAGILHENKILPTDKLIEVDRSGLVGQYVGETPQKTMRQIERAMGGVLFVDEAYALVPKDGGFDYGNEAVATLIKAMEDYRGKFCVILAGYKNQMADMIASNPGFKSRIQFELDFPNYSRDELGQIISFMLEKRKYTLTDMAMSKILDITDVKRKEPNFANAREIRNILDQVIMCQNLRCSGDGNREIGLADVNRYISDSRINLPISGSGSKTKILTAEEELDRLVGLASIKRMVKKIKAYAKRNKQEEGFNLHMCFYGNPGTGKTEVARIISRILYDAGVLPEAKLIETDAHGLIGRYVGETAPKTEEKVREAMGGVLFVDEAYGLSTDVDGGGSSKSYGEEAIAVLLKQMEDHRGQFCAVFAGYEKEMQAMLGTNPGLKSRIQFTLEFPDYTREELGEISLQFLRKKGYEIAEDALEKLLDLTDYYREMPNFANARTARNILDQVIMNQNLRTEEDDTTNNEVILSDVEDYILDEKINLRSTGGGARKIGFC